MRLVSRAAVRVAEAIDAFGSWLTGALSFINSFVVVILTPEEIAYYTKQVYEKKKDVSFSQYRDREWIDKGLYPSEKDVIEKHAGKCGSFVVLGCGGGREAIALARMGFDVTGIDSSEKMILKAKEHAAGERVKVKLTTADFLKMPFPAGTFDHCLLSCVMYSVVPSRAMRVALLSGIGDLLTDKGIAIIHFITVYGDRSERLFKLRRSVARLFKGNTSYETGDELFPPNHFFRRFIDDRQVIDEVHEAGLSVREIIKDRDSDIGRYAVLEKARN